MHYLFRDYLRTDFSGIDIWNTSKVTNMSELFAGLFEFNEDISGWNTSSVTDMSSMFDKARDFNQPIGKWDTSNKTFPTIDLYVQSFKQIKVITRFVAYLIL